MFVGACRVLRAPSLCASLRNREGLELRIRIVIRRLGPWGGPTACAVFLVAAGCRNGGSRDAREAALRENLHTFRSVLEQYHGDKGRYPSSLCDLVSEGYIRSIPYDPMTRSRDTWKVVYAYPGTPLPGEVSRFVVTDVRSGAGGRGSDGRPYSSW